MIRSRLGRGLLVFALVAATGGCLKVKDHLTLNADGSGTVRLEVFSAVTPEALRGGRYSGWLRNLEQSDQVVYPPLHAEHAEKLFPGKAFTVKATESEGGDEAPALVVEVAFQDVNALVASPYGEAHALSLRRDGDVLRVAAHSGFAGAVLASDSDQMQHIIRRHAAGKGEMAAEFVVSLPAAVTGSSGQAKGRTATWKLARANAKGDAAREIEMFVRPLRAACSAEGLGFTPVSPPRLGLFLFNELTAGPAEGMPRPPAPEQVTAATRFEARYVKSVRAFPLPGRAPDPEDRSSLHQPLQPNAVEVVGLLSLPRALAPDQWGVPTVEEARDDRGTDLRIRAAERGRHARTPPWDSLFEQEFAKKTASEVRQVLRFRVNNPGPDATRIAALRGPVMLEYFGDFQVVKLPNAIPLEWVRRHTAEGRMVGGAQGHTKIESQFLEELGIEVRVVRVEHEQTHGRAKQERTRFWFTITSRDAQVIEVQPYDAQGRPWPKVHWAGHFSARSDPLHFALPLHAEPPFSLAMLVSATRVRAAVPIELKDIPLAAENEQEREERP